MLSPQCMEQANIITPIIDEGGQPGKQKGTIPRDSVDCQAVKTCKSRTESATFLDRSGALWLLSLTVSGPHGIIDFQRNQASVEVCRL